MSYVAADNVVIERCAVTIPRSLYFRHSTILPSNIAVNIDYLTSFIANAVRQKMEECIKLVEPEQLALVDLQVEHAQYKIFLVSSPLSKNNRFIFVPALASEKTPPERLTIQYRLHTLSSLR